MHIPKKAAKEVLLGISLGLERSLSHLWRSYVVTAVGQVLLLCAIYAVHRVILLTGVSIPASVVCMVLLLALLLVLEALLGTRRTARVVRFFEGAALLQDHATAVTAPAAGRLTGGGPAPSVASLPATVRVATATSATENIELDSVHFSTPAPSLRRAPATVDNSLRARAARFFVLGGPAGFSLRWINVCFTPAFVLLPLSERVSAPEALEIAAVFVVGYLVTVALTVYIVWALQRVIGKPRRSYAEDVGRRQDDDDDEDGGVEVQNVESTAEQVLQPAAQEETAKGTVSQTVEKVLRLGKNKKTLTTAAADEEQAGSSVTHHHTREGDLGIAQKNDAVALAYEQAVVEHAHGDIDNIPGRRASVGSDIAEDDAIAASPTSPTSLERKASGRGAHDDGASVKTREYTAEESDGGAASVAAAPPSAPRRPALRIRVAQFVIRRIDWLLYTALLAAGAAVYWAAAASYAALAQLGMLVLCFLAAMRVPHRYRTYLHPILVSSALAIFGIFLLGVVYTATIPAAAFGEAAVARAVDNAMAQISAAGQAAAAPTFVGFSIKAPGGGGALLPADQVRAKIASAVLTHRTYGFTSLRQALWQFKTGRTYLTLFDSAAAQPLLYNPKTQAFEPALPGAGDIMSTLLDTSIVALAVPMYNYRGDLKRNFWILMIPCIFLALASFFAYPPVCHAVGIQATRALAFVGRSVTLALALPVVASLGGSSTLVSVVGILSGIVGAVVGDRLLRRGLRVRHDDYVTIGIAMGVNSSAIGSAHLLATNPRASALSSLAFFVFGTTLVVMAAITPLVNIIRAWVGLEAL